MKYAALAGLLLAGVAAENNDKDTALKYVQIVEGFLDGAADAEGFTDIDKCIKDAEGITDIAADMI
jgi:dihydroxyacetone kinase DhaKLM complex PTS-EIIA-like component DhaM